ncbi:MAG: hypothetical protein ACE5D3_08555, partial [Candidatus Binatia bacterium]
DEFRGIYGEKGRPRVAVFLNRELSDDVRDWSVAGRAVVAFDGHETRQRPGAPEATSEKFNGAVGIAAVVEEEAGDSGKRDLGAGEAWSWAFEDGFVQPLLQAGVRVVDRATIVRLAGAESTHSATQPAPAKKIEINALKEHADIFIEVLIARSPFSTNGFEFKATAKEVQSGLVLANVTSMNWAAHARRGRTIVATADGYKVARQLAPRDAGVVASHLAIDLVSELARTWGE